MLDRVMADSSVQDSPLDTVLLAGISRMLFPPLIHEKFAKVDVLFVDDLRCRTLLVYYEELKSNEPVDLIKLQKTLEKVSAHSMLTSAKLRL